MQDLTTNLTIEAAAISLLVREKDSAKEILVIPSYFFNDPLYRKLFEFILKMHAREKKIPTFPALSSYLPELVENQSDLARFQGLMTLLSNSDATKDDQKIIIETLKRDYQTRQLQQAQLNASDLLSTGKISQACDLLDKTIVGIKNEDRFLDHVDNLGELLHDVEEQKPNFVKSGLGTLDMTTGGFAPQELIIIAGPRGTGKSTLLMQLAVNACKTKRKAVYVNLEMSRREWTCRLFSNLSGLPYSKVRAFQLEPVERFMLRSKVGHFFVTDKAEFSDWVRKNQGAVAKSSAVDFHEQLKKFKLDNEIVHLSQEVETIPRLAIKLLHLKKMNRCDIVMIDYLNFLKHGPAHYEFHERLGEAALKLKEIAKSLEVPVIALAQSTGEGEVKYSRAVEEHADQVILWDDRPEPGVSIWRFNAKMTKSRNSATCSVLLEADFSKMTIIEAGSLENIV